MPQDYACDITRQDFNDVVKANFLVCFQVLESKLISEAARRGISINNEEVYIFKAGGSSKLTAIHEYLCTHYNKVVLPLACLIVGQDRILSSDPDSAIVKGACISLRGQGPLPRPGPEFRDQTPNYVTVNNFAAN